MPSNALRINYLKLPIVWRFIVPMIRSIEVMAAYHNVPKTYEEFTAMFLKLYPEEKPRKAGNMKDMINIISWKLNDGKGKRAYCSKEGAIRHTVLVEDRAEHYGYRCEINEDHFLCKCRSGNDGKGKSKKEIVVWFDETTFDIFNTIETVLPDAKDRVRRRNRVEDELVSPSDSSAAEGSDQGNEMEVDGVDDGVDHDDEVDGNSEMTLTEPQLLSMFSLRPLRNTHKLRQTCQPLSPSEERTNS